LRLLSVAGVSCRFPVASIAGSTIRAQNKTLFNLLSKEEAEKIGMINATREIVFRLLFHQNAIWEK